MQPSDVEAFFAVRASLDSSEHLEIDITFECVGDPRVAAAHLASEQSTAQWHRVGVVEDFRPRFAAKVLSLSSEPLVNGFSVPVFGAPSGEVHRCRVTIAHPHRNFGPRLPNLLSAILGEGVFFAPGIPVVRVEDIRFPDAYLARFEGPQFGIGGVRAQLGVYDRPIFFGVIKPNIGLAPEPFAQLGYDAWMGGLDVAKDDEMLADASYSPLAERARLLGDFRTRAARETGEAKGYLANITDEVDQLAANHDVAVAAGATMVMLNALPVGMSAIRTVRKHARVPIVTHFPFIAPMSRVAGYGVHSRVFTRLQRLAGADVIIMPGFGARMFTPAEEVLANVRACTEPMGSIAPSLPVPGGSDSAATLADVFARLDSIDFGFVPGRGVFGHPGGPTAGARSVRQAWDAISQGVPLAEYAENYAELRGALGAFGPSN